MDKLRLLLLVLYSQISAAIVIKQISQWIGTPVTLECSPQHVVDCTWLFNEKSINIANRYQYSLSDSDGLNTTKCTLLINLFHEEDIGNWTCWSMSTDARDGHLMETYELKIKTKQSDGFLFAHPRNVTAAFGETVILPCIFSINIEQCNWFRNGDIISTSERYKYLSQMSDCTLRIINLQSIDIGSWQCTTSANNRYGYIFSKVAWVHILGIPLTTSTKLSSTSVVEHPQNVTVAIGTTSTLTCKFKDSVNCVWFRKGHVIHIGYRYSYLNNKNVLQTTDCSMKISNVQMIDDGMWQCIGAADDSHGVISSQPVFLTITYDNRKPVSILSHPKVTIVHYGRESTMKCLFNSTVNCVWRRNNKIVMIQGRYKYINSNGVATKDCSISIATTNEVDMGLWKCESLRDYTHAPSVESNEASLSLFKAPTNPVIKLNGKDVAEVQLPFSKETATFTCTSTMGHPEPSLQWQIDGINVFTIHFVSNKYNDYHSNATTFITMNRILKQTKTPSVLKCIAFHPSFESNIPYAEVLFKTSEPTQQKPPSIKVHPQRKVAKDGQIVTLDCIFDQPVDCYWNYNGNFMFDINITFTDGNGGKNTIDCSIRLPAFSEEMVGQWQCSSMATEYYKEVKSMQASLVRMKTPTGPFIKLNYEEVSELSLVDLDFGRDKLTCHSYRGNPAAELLIVLTSSVNEIPLTPTWGQTTYSEASLFDVIVGITPTTNQTFISNIYKYDSLVCILVHPTLEAPRYKDVTFINPTNNSSNSEDEVIVKTEKQLSNGSTDSQNGESESNVTTTLSTNLTSLWSLDEFNDTTSVFESQNSMHLNTKFAAIGSSLFIIFLIILGLGITMYYRYRRHPNNDCLPSFISKFLIFKKRPSSGDDQLIKYTEHVPENNAENDDGIYF